MLTLFQHKLIDATMVDVRCPLLFRPPNAVSNGPLDFAAVEAPPKIIFCKMQMLDWRRHLSCVYCNCKRNFICMFLMKLIYAMLKSLDIRYLHQAKKWLGQDEKQSRSSPRRVWGPSEHWWACAVSTAGSTHCNLIDWSSWNSLASWSKNHF